MAKLKIEYPEYFYYETLFCSTYTFAGDDETASDEDDAGKKKKKRVTKRTMKLSPSFEEDYVGDFSLLSLKDALLTDGLFHLDDPKSGFWSANERENVEPLVQFSDDGNENSEVFKFVVDFTADGKETQETSNGWGNDT
ncbi:predicted protein [Sclerotinia sclerotiorum 1980 UF-70]|uniref:Uncharacterized protein n=1 Tax=Sclerotinia sclerotiorum (strain ATCC 18683 / 1980 / Ss-1) TaxID=665079 RepID=A7EFP2_SCLS1|nr:predicted protein [Sclerotinia sclerotiorum 1980 UF-70]EDO01658.1 predicted protein [Sclerotinia sclerotiorum 1980 UF-70]